MSCIWSLGSPHAPPDAECSFCQHKVGDPVGAGIREEVVRYIIQGPKVTICDDCVSLCVEILKEKGIENPSNKREGQ